MGRVVCSSKSVEPAKCNTHRVESQANVKKASGSNNSAVGEGGGNTRKGTRDRLSCVGEDLRALQVVLHSTARGAVLVALLLCTRPTARSARGSPSPSLDRIRQWQVEAMVPSYDGLWTRERSAGGRMRCAATYAAL